MASVLYQDTILELLELHRLVKYIYQHVFIIDSTNTGHWRWYGYLRLEYSDLFLTSPRKLDDSYRDHLEKCLVFCQMMDDMRSMAIVKYTGNDDQWDGMLDLCEDISARM